MLLFIFFGLVVGFALSLRSVGDLRRTIIWGGLLGGVPLFLLLGPANLPVQGIGSVLYFAFFALGPIMLVPFVLSSIALGLAGGAIVLWVGQQHGRRASRATGLVLLCLVGSMTLWPVGHREITKRQHAADRAVRAEEIIRADFFGTVAGHRVNFPASPRLAIVDDCKPPEQERLYGCTTSLVNPVSRFTKPEDVLLHERHDPIKILTISVDAVEQNCRAGNEYCLTQSKVDQWCKEVRPDQVNSIWCLDKPAMRFWFSTDVTPNPSDREEPELEARYADTPLGPGAITCFYSPIPEETDRQGTSCELTFPIADGVYALVGASREQLVSGDAVLSEAIAQIPEYWISLTETQ